MRNNTLTEQRFDSLPKFAQDEIRSLDNQVTLLKTRLEVLEGKTETDVHYHQGLEMGYPGHPLPQGCTVDFLLTYGPKNQFKCHVRVEKRDNGVKINADTGIVITPEAGNAVIVNVRG